MAYRICVQLVFVFCRTFSDNHVLEGIRTLERSDTEFVSKTIPDQLACGAEMEPLPITLLTRCGCSWQHAVCRVNHPSGMPLVSPHGIFFLLILTGMRLDVEDTLFLYPLPLPHLCRAKNKVRQLRSQADRIQANELASRSLKDTCPPCCCISHNLHYRSFSPACSHPHYTCAGSIIATRVSFSYSCCLYKSNSVLVKKQNRKTGNIKHVTFICFKRHFVLMNPY